MTTPGVVLVTGGAGFIGSHLVDRLVDDGRSVRVIDVIEPQVHLDSVGHRNPHAEYRDGSLLDASFVAGALDDVRTVVHLAAQVGVGQSMYQIRRYVEHNCLGTAVLLEELLRQDQELDALVVASSMSIYGEGRYICEGCGDSDAEIERTLASLQAHEWEPVCTSCGSPVVAAPTHEGTRLRPDSIYAVTKRDQEEMCLAWGRAYGVPAVALRFFNVFGPRQALSNPYTGVVAIFLGRLLNRRPPLVFEDGLQSRDFVDVSDVVSAIMLALGSPQAAGLALNVGTGRATTVLDVALTLGELLGVDVEPEILGRFRHGDIRHCYADVDRARLVLGYEPRVSLREGMERLADWVASAQPQAHDRVDESTRELHKYDLML